MELGQYPSAHRNRLAATEAASMVGFVLASLQQETPDFIGSGWIGERQSGSGNNANKEHPDCHSPIEAIHHQHRNEECGSYQRDGSDMKELIHQYGAWIVFGLVFLEFDWSAAAGRSDLGKCCGLRRDDARAWHRPRSSLRCVQGRYWAAPSASGSATDTDIRCCCGTAPISD